MVRINDSRMESADGIGGFADRHCVGLIHADKRQIDVREGTYLGRIPSIAADQNAARGNGKQVTVASANRMIGVVSGDGLNVQSQQVRACSVAEDASNRFLGRGELVEDILRGDNEAVGFNDGIDHGSVEMVEMTMRHKDEVGFGKAGITG